MLFLPNARGRLATSLGRPLEVCRLSIATAMPPWSLPTLCWASATARGGEKIEAFNPRCMWFSDQMGLSLPFLEVSVNRDNFGGRRLQFSAPGRNIERVSARSNGHDQPVGCDEKWIFSNKEKRRFFSHVIHLPQNARLSLTASNYGLNGRTVRADRLRLSLG
jgi:hypothetical protein